MIGLRRERNWKFLSYHLIVKNRKIFNVKKFYKKCVIGDSWEALNYSYFFY